MKRSWILPAVIALIAVGAGVSAAKPKSPDAFTTYTGSHSISYDSNGNPTQASLTLKGQPVSSGYRLCLSIVPDTKPSYNDLDYGTHCKTFSFGTGTSTTQKFGTNFPWGGPAEYQATWAVPPTAEPEATDTFKWAFQGGGFSPCPPDPWLQRDVWQPSRHTIINRCKTWQGTVAKDPTTSSLDNDKDWKINYTNGSTLQVEYMPSDKGRLRSPCDFDCSLPSKGETWELTGVFVCDTNHGWKELHPVFLAKEIQNGSVVRTLLSGPQYSTYVWPGPYPTFQPQSC